MKNTCLLAAILCAALLSACGNILSPGGGTGTITISFAPAGIIPINRAARIAIPDSDLVSMTHEITLTGPGGQTIQRTISGAGGTVSVEVAPGVWHISIITRGPLPPFYYGAMLREFGESRVAVSAGQQTQAGIHMSPALGVETPAQLEYAIDAIGEFGAASVIILMADITSPPLTLTGGNITLRGLDSQRRISLSGNGSLFTVAGGASLTLSEDIALEGHGANDAPLVSLESGGRLYMNSGTVISGNTSIGSTGGGVWVSQGASFTMLGGAIYANRAGRGGGVFVSDGGTFTLSGGVVYGANAPAGRANASTAVRGASLFVESGGNARFAGAYQARYGADLIPSTSYTLPRNLDDLESNLAGFTLSLADFTDRPPDVDIPGPDISLYDLQFQSAMLSISVSGSEFSNARWLLGGAQIGTGANIDLGFTHLNQVGIYRLTVIADVLIGAAQVPFSRIISIEVTL